MIILLIFLVKLEIEKKTILLFMLGDMARFAIIMVYTDSVSTFSFLSGGERLTAQLK